MKQRYIRLFSILLLLVPAFTGAVPTFNSMEFIENQGQWDGPFRYRVSSRNEQIYLQDNSLTFFLSDPANEAFMESLKHGNVAAPHVLKFHAYRLSFEGANPQPAIVGSKAEAHYYNYFVGNDQTKWKSGIHPNRAVDYKNLYDGVDLHLSSENEQLKYEFIVQPGTDAKQIRLRYEGQDKLNIKNGNLVIGTSVGEIKELKPYAYQLINGEKTEVPCNYRLRGSVVEYAFPAGYDATQTLIIDPTVVFATFTGASADNWGFTATYDAAGNFYAGGIVHYFAPNEAPSPGTFPTSIGAFQSVYNGGSSTTGSLYPCDMVIFKYNAAGSAFLYATFIGGTDNDQPHSLFVDASNNLVIAGRTYSSNYPTTPGAYDQSYNGAGDIVVTKLNATGTTLLGSTFIGGSGDDAVNFDAKEPVAGNLKHNYGDDARSEVILDNQGNVYVAAPTKSTNFPVTANAFQPVSGGAQDGVVFKMNSALTSLIWSTYMGGSSDDAAYVLALDNNQTHLYVAGGTMSSNFPSTPGTYMPTYQGGSSDGYIARILNSGNYPLQRVTFMGTGNYDQCFGVQIDLANNVYAMGQTLGGTFPVTAGVYSNPNSSQFIIKMDSLLTTNIYSTVFGSSNPAATNISPVAFLVDTCENVYISGWGGNLGFSAYTGVGNTFNMPLSAAPNAPVQTTTDGKDFYFIVLSKNAQSLLYGSYMGGNGVEEHVDGGTSRFDKNGVIYQAICGGCGGSSVFPSTAGSVSTVNGSINCNLIAVKIAFQFILSAKAKITPDTSGCAPLTINFQNNSTYAIGYEWDFGDNTSSTAQTPPAHTYTIPGTYHIRLIAINGNACNRTRDTTYLTVIVTNNSIKSGFNFVVTDSCNPFKVTFSNTSQFSPTPGSQGFTRFKWYFGDNTTYTGANPPPHSYPAAGTYTVKLVMYDSTACNNPDSITRIVQINNNFVKATFTAANACVNKPITFTSTATNATSYSWNFGDQQSATTPSPTHTYTTPGTYTVTLIASNPGSCNKADTIKQTVKVGALPKADFDYSPHIPVTNTPVNFTNLSQGADSYFWTFGDNTSSTDVNPSHLYKRSGKFRVCLVARTTDGCSDTVCKDVESDIRPLADVPTAFSPNGDGANDILYVRGGAIEKMNFKIFNRWGELVFETNDMAIGWDGTYKGKPQEMDAYAFVLNVTFIDATTFYKKGNVTLLR